MSPMPRLPSPMLRHRLTPSRPYNARARHGRLLPSHLPRALPPSACCRRPSARRLYLHLPAEKPGRARDIQESSSDIVQSSPDAASCYRPRYTHIGKLHKPPQRRSVLGCAVMTGTRIRKLRAPADHCGDCRKRLRSVRPAPSPARQGAQKQLRLTALRQGAQAVVFGSAILRLPAARGPIRNSPGHRLRGPKEPHGSGQVAPLAQHHINQRHRDRTPGSETAPRHSPNRSSSTASVALPRPNKLGSYR